MINIDHKDAVLRTFILFIQTAREVTKYADAHLYRKMRLSTTKLIVLQALASNGGRMMPSKIAEWTQTERHNITALIGRMKKERLITAERDTSNKRNVNITMTDRGWEVLSQATPAAREIVDQVMLSITESNTALLEEILRALRQNADRGLKGFAKQKVR